ncbi:MAG TPA: hypothetical protein VEA40_14740 [Ramlibacter sp.]|nr:hypothetical protein [Ramlibacter sp.]
MAAGGTDTDFQDSEFDWDSLSSSPSGLRSLPATSMERLAWAVLVLLAFCPAVGLALALWLR